MTWIRSLYVFLNFLCFQNHYSIKIAKTKNEKEQVFKFRYSIYRIELEGFFLDSNEAKHGMIYDEYDFDDNVVILYSGDLEHITGTVRIAAWHKTILPMQIKNKYGLNETMLNDINTIGEIRYFQVRKDKRKSLLGIMLLCYLYKVVADHPSLVSDIIFCDCQPGLLSLYSKVGCFVYSNKMIYEHYGILQVPLAIATFDLQYLRKTHAVTYHIAKYYFHIYKNKVGIDLAKKKCRDFFTIFPHLTLYQTADEMHQYRQNMVTETSKKFYDSIVKILQYYLVIPLEPHTIVIKNNIVDYDMYIVLTGKLGVYIDNQLIAELMPGTFVGEMAFFDPHHKRYADVKALAYSKILLVPRNLLDTLIKKNPKVAIDLLIALCSNLLDKLAASNKLLKQRPKAPSNHT